MSRIELRNELTISGVVSVHAEQATPNKPGATDTFWKLYFRDAEGNVTTVTVFGAHNGDWGDGYGYLPIKWRVSAIVASQDEYLAAGMAD